MQFRCRCYEILDKVYNVCSKGEKQNALTADCDNRLVHSMCRM